MKHTKLATTIVTLAAAGMFLTACGSDSDKGTAASSSSTASTTEVVSGASVSDKASDLEKALGADGNWIVATTADVTFDNDVTVAGEFHDKGEAGNDIYRKFALYAQDDNRTVTDEYTVTVPTLIVESENFNIVHGTVKGNIEVKANGFVLNGAKVEGNITFEKQEYKDSAVLDEDGASVTGDVTVAE